MDIKYDFVAHEIISSVKSIDDYGSLVQQVNHVHVAKGELRRTRETRKSSKVKRGSQAHTKKSH